MCMKKKSGSRSLLFATTLCLFFLTACQKFTANDKQDNDKIINSSNLRSTSLPVVSLKVTISDVNGSFSVYNITSDGKGDYLNGVDYVEAVLDGWGTFAFNTLNSSRPATVAKRWVNYNFNNPVESNNTYRPSPSNTKNYHFSTGGTAYGTNPFIPIQNLGVNGNPSTECIYMGNGIYNSTSGWRVSFHKGYEDISNGPTSFAVVTRTSISPAIWTITPVGICSPNSNIASLRSQDGSLLYGYYYLPFFFTLTAL